MTLSPDRLIAIGTQFFSAMNARDYPSAASLYAADAVYQSPALIEAGLPGGRIEGRGQIMSYFKEALTGDDDFQLSTLDQFTGVNMTVVLSSLDGQTFVDVLRTDDDGLIVEHLEVRPKRSEIDHPGRHS